MKQEETREVTKENKKYIFDYELLKKKRKKLIIIMVSTLIWMCVVASVFFMFTKISIDSYGSINNKVEDIASDGYNTGEEFVTLGYGIGGLFAMIVGAFSSILAIFILCVAVAYLLMAIITWILAMNKKKCASIFAWISFTIFILVFLTILVFSANMLFSIIAFVGLALGILHGMYTVQYSKVFKRNNLENNNLAS